MFRLVQCERLLYILYLEITLSSMIIISCDESVVKVTMHGLALSLEHGVVISIRY